MKQPGKYPCEWELAFLVAEEQSFPEVGLAPAILAEVFQLASSQGCIKASQTSRCAGA